MDEKRTVPVTFYRFPDGKKWVTQWMTASVIWAEVLHPTRITPEEWNEILEIAPHKVQEILSIYLKI